MMQTHCKLLYKMNIGKLSNVQRRYIFTVIITIFKIFIIHFLRQTHCKLLHNMSFGMLSNVVAFKNITNVN